MSISLRLPNVSRAALGIIAALALALAGAAIWGALEGKRADKWRDAYKAAVAASQANIAATAAMRTQERAEYERKAHAADTSHAAALDRVRTVTDRYVARNRVQPSSCSAPQPIGAADHPGQPAPVPADSLVAVSEPDVQACAGAATYAVTAYNFLQAIGE